MSHTRGVGRRALSWAAGAVALLASLTALSPLASSSAAAQKPRQPNVLFIISDDQTYDTLDVMPAVQALQHRGTTYTRYYDSFPLCCPTRAAFLSGQYSHNNGVWDNIAPRGGYSALRDKDNTLPKWLHDAGYRTAILGKLLNQYSMSTWGIPAGWDLFRGTEGEVYNYDATTIRDETGKVTEYAGYKTDVYAQLAVNMLDELNTGQPWFFWLAPNAPHVGRPRDSDDSAELESCSPSPTWRDTEQSTPLPANPAFNEADVSDKPYHIRRLSLLTPAKVSAIHEAYTQQLECLRSLDTLVADVVAKLDATGQLDNTDIIYVSDNGFAYGEHRVPAGKKLPYDYATHLPLIAAGPDFPHRVDSGMRSSVDVTPTILQVAGAGPEHVIDGKSLLTKPDPYRAILNEGRVVGHNSLAATITKYVGIRTKYWLYARYRYRGGTSEAELYNRVMDPAELTSVVNDPKYQDVRQRLDDWVNEIKDCVGTDCP